MLTCVAVQAEPRACALPALQRVSVVAHLAQSAMESPLPCGATTLKVVLAFWSVMIIRGFSLYLLYPMYLYLAGHRHDRIILITGLAPGWGADLLAQSQLLSRRRLILSFG